MEVIPENFFFSRGTVKTLTERFPIVLHSVGLSLGSSLKINHVEQLKELIALSSAHWLSDHVSYTHVNGLEIGHLTPVPFTEEAALKIIENLRRVKDAVSCPVAIENITYQFRWPNNEMSEAQFLTTILEEADVGLLLDVENVYNNATNHRYDAVDFIDRLPLNRLFQIHLAGGRWKENRRLDTHDNIVEEEVWALLRHVRSRVMIPAVTLEWDRNLPPFDVILEQLSRARAIVG